MWGRRGRRSIGLEYALLLLLLLRLCLLIHRILVNHSVAGPGCHHQMRLGDSSNPHVPRDGPADGRAPCISSSSSSSSCGRVHSGEAGSHRGRRANVGGHAGRWRHSSVLLWHIVHRCPSGGWVRWEGRGVILLTPRGSCCYSSGGGGSSSGTTLEATRGVPKLLSWGDKTRVGLRTLKLLLLLLLGHDTWNFLLQVGGLRHRHSLGLIEVLLLLRLQAKREKNPLIQFRHYTQGKGNSITEEGYDQTRISHWASPLQQMARGKAQQ